MCPLCVKSLNACLPSRTLLILADLAKTASFLGVFSLAFLNNSICFLWLNAILVSMCYFPWLRPSWYLVPGFPVDLLDIISLSFLKTPTKCASVLRWFFFFFWRPCRYVVFADVCETHSIWCFRWISWNPSWYVVFGILVNFIMLELHSSYYVTYINFKTFDYITRVRVRVSELM